MPATVEYASEASILSDVIAPDRPSFTRELAQWLTTLRFTEHQRSRIVELADKGNRGELTPPEHEELDRFRRIGMLLNLLQSKAELSLRQPSPEI